MGPPSLVVEAARITLLPAFKFTLKVCVAQVSQVPVPLKASDEFTTVPFTLMAIGRAVVVPLA